MEKKGVTEWELSWRRYYVEEFNFIFNDYFYRYAIIYTVKNII